MHYIHIYFIQPLTIQLKLLSVHNIMYINNKMELYSEHELNLLSRFSKLFLSPEEFAEPQPSKVNEIKHITKDLYDNTYFSKSLNDLQTNSLPKLLIDGFDDEQIWQQIDLLNKSAVTQFSKLISNLDVEKVALECNDSSAVPNALKPQRYENDLDKLSSDSENEEYAFDGDSDSSVDLSHLSQRDNYAYDDDDSGSSMEHDKADQRKSFKISEKELDSETDDKSQAKIKQTLKPLVYKSEVDDQFFKLSKLEEFLRLEDLKEEKGYKESSDEEDIDLFQDIPSDNIDDSDSNDNVGIMKQKNVSKDFMYEEFFDAPELEDGSIYKEHSKTNEGINELEDDSDNELEDNSDNEFNSVEDFELSNDQSETRKMEENKTTQKTAFELEQEKIKKKIQECEESMLQPLPWHLTGEVAASSRPIDSLIEKDTEFDCNAKQDLIVDDALTEKIENIIKMAIANKAFSDVERKVKPPEEVIAYKKEIVLDQNKSKKGLAEIYEEDYLKKQTKEVEEENPKHKEIKKLMDELFPELQALFSHIPKPAVPEIKIVSNLPAVTVEEVAPTSVSDAALLAPEEVKKKSGLIKGKTERTDTDRKRERRKKKLLQKFKQKKKEARESLQSKPTSSKARKMEKIEILKKLKQQKNTKIANADGAKVKSSKDFFSKLQDTVHSKSSKKQMMKSSKRNNKL